MINPIKLLKLAIITLAFVAFLAFGLSAKRARAFVHGPPYGHTGAPGEFTCIECHTSFPLNSGLGAVHITGLPATYVPGEQVQVTVTTFHPDGFLYGFEVTAIDQTGDAAGTFTITDANNTQLTMGGIGNFIRHYVEHTFAGAFPVEFDQRVWSFRWNAPQICVGPITFYAAGNGANGDGETTNDYIYTSSVSLLPRYTLSLQDQFFAMSGGSGSVTVTTAASCAWSAVASDSWITITSKDSGTGEGTITFEVRENFTGSARQGSIEIAGQIFSVVQDGGLGEDCEYSITPTFQSFPASGGTGIVQVTAAERCAWEAVSNTSWVTITSPSAGIGNGSVTYSVGPNSASIGRKGTITIAGRTFSIKQKAH